MSEPSDARTIAYVRLLLSGVQDGSWDAETACQRLRELVDGAQVDVGREFADLQATGLLWFINRSLFWPRGYALELVASTVDGSILGWNVGWDGEPIMSGDPDAEAGKLAAVEALLASSRGDA